eukprot:g10253.t1
MHVLRVCSAIAVFGICAPTGLRAQQANRAFNTVTSRAEQAGFTGHKPQIIGDYRGNTLTIAWQVYKADGKMANDVAISRYQLDGQNARLLWSRRMGHDRLAGMTADTAGRNFYVLTARDEDLGQNTTIVNFRRNILYLTKLTSAGGSNWRVDLNNAGFLKPAENGKAGAAIFSPLTAGSAAIAFGKGRVGVILASNTLPDGKFRHQRAQFFIVGENGEGNLGYGETSGRHSFDQRLIFDGSDFVIADLGDAGWYMPAGGIAMRKLLLPARGRATVAPIQAEGMFVYARQGETLGGKNFTFTSLGDLVSGQSGYTVLFSSEKTNDGQPRDGGKQPIKEPRNLGLVHVTRQFHTVQDSVNKHPDSPDKTMAGNVCFDWTRGYFPHLINVTNRVVDSRGTASRTFSRPGEPQKKFRQTGIVWLTGHTSGSSVERPKLIKVATGKYVALWEEWTWNNTKQPWYVFQHARTRAMLIDEYGEPTAANQANAAVASLNEGNPPANKTNAQDNTQQSPSGNGMGTPSARQPVAQSPVAKTPVKTDPSQPTNGGTTPGSKPAARPTVKVPTQAANVPALETPPKSAGTGQLTREVLARVKKATVLLNVTAGDGSMGSGTGFFAIDNKTIVTNAHVVGMLNAGSSRPKEVEVVVNSGEPTEWKMPAKVLGVDRSADLAVLTTSPPAAKMPLLPAPLKVYSARALFETQQVYVFGFPFGESLGKNITVSKTSVSSLRKSKHGDLNRVQVNGGMHPGNSGGPVVDAGGNVIGVAVSGIPGTQVNFAIPGDSVYGVFDGRIAGIGFGESQQKGKITMLPITIRTIDPLNRIRRVSVTWWFGKPGKGRQPSATAPQALPDDSPHQVVQLSYKNPVATATLSIPVAPSGKTVFIQPMYESGGGKSQWMASTTFEPEPIVESVSVMLRHKQNAGTKEIHLNSRSYLEYSVYGGEELSLLAHIDTRLVETTRLNGRGGRATKKMSVGRLECGVSINKKAPPATRRMQQMFNNLRFLTMHVAEDKRGNLVERRLDMTNMPLDSQALLGRLGRQMSESLDVVSIPLPNREVKPGTTWTAERLVPVDTPESFKTGSVRMRYRYLGLTTYKGRRVAVISFRGTMHGLRSRSFQLTGRARGKAYYDLERQYVDKSNAKLDVQLTVTYGRRTAKAHGELRVNLDRNPPPRAARK